MIRRTTLISALAVTLLSLAACVQGDVPRDQTPSPDTAPTLAARTPAPDTSPTPTHPLTVPLSLNLHAPPVRLVLSTAGRRLCGATLPAPARATAAANPSATCVCVLNSSVVISCLLSPVSCVALSIRCCAGRRITRMGRATGFIRLSGLDRIASPRASGDLSGMSFARRAKGHRASLEPRPRPSACPTNRRLWLPTRTQNTPTQCG